MTIMDQIRPREPRFVDLEEGIREKVTTLPERTPPSPQPSLDNISELVARSLVALTDEHSNLLARAKALFTQVESCLKSAQEAREAMLAARKEALREESKS